MRPLYPTMTRVPTKAVMYFPFMILNLYFMFKNAQFSVNDWKILEVNHWLGSNSPYFILRVYELSRSHASQSLKVGSRTGKIVFGAI